MYTPHHFAEDRPEALLGLIKKYPLATLITHGLNGLTANLIPFVIGPDSGQSLTFCGHLARGNDQLKDLAQGNETFLIFQGPDNYVTPTWYESKKENGKVVPTWNYITVQVWGHAVIHDDVSWLGTHVNSLTNTHEAGRENPWLVSDAPDDFIAKQLKAIVGVEIMVTRMEGKWKISQNRTEADREGVIAGMHTEDPNLSAAMRDYYDSK